MLFIVYSELLAVALNKSSAALLHSMISWYSIIKSSGSVPRGLTLHVCGVWRSVFIHFVKYKTNGIKQLMEASYVFCEAGTEFLC